MDATVTYKCPNCDAGLTFDPEKQKFICEFCISDFTEDELKYLEVVVLLITYNVDVLVEAVFSETLLSSTKVLSHIY